MVGAIYKLPQPLITFQVVREFCPRLMDETIFLTETIGFARSLVASLGKL
jgi:hypothetical protein